MSTTSGMIRQLDVVVDKVKDFFGTYPHESGKDTDRDKSDSDSESDSDSDDDDDDDDDHTNVHPSTPPPTPPPTPAPLPIDSSNSSAPNQSSNSSAPNQSSNSSAPNQSSNSSGPLGSSEDHHGFNSVSAESTRRGHDDNDNVLTMGLLGAVGVFFIACCALAICVFRLKRQLNSVRQETHLMRRTSEPYGQPRAVVVAVPTDGSPIAGVPVDEKPEGILANEKSVEEGLKAPREDENEF